MQIQRQASSQTRSKRLGLLDAVDDSHKSELQAMASLGSDSFDSLLAYLTEAEVEPAAMTGSLEPVKSIRDGRSTKEASARDRAPTSSRCSTMAPRAASHYDSRHINHFAFEAWLANEMDEYARTGAATNRSSGKDSQRKG